MELWRAWNGKSTQTNPGWKWRRLRTSPSPSPSRVWSLMQTTLQRWKAGLPFSLEKASWCWAIRVLAPKGLETHPSQSQEMALDDGEQPEEFEAEAYKKALASLKKAIQTLSSSLDKGSVLKESL